MIRRTLVRVGGAFAVLGGLVLASLAVQNVAIWAGFFGTTEFPTPKQVVVLTILGRIESFVIPSSVMVGLIGLYALLGASPASKWGFGLATAATLLILVRFQIPSYVSFEDPSPGNDAMGTVLIVLGTLSVLTSAVFATSLVLLYLAARRSHRLGPWRRLLPTIGLAVILSSASPFALSAAGLPGVVPLFTALTFVIGALWLALGFAVWREAPSPENHNVGAKPMIP